MTAPADRDPDILSTEELAARIGLSAPTVRRAASRGDIPGLRIGKDWRFSYSAVVASIRSPHPQPEPPIDSYNGEVPPPSFGDPYDDMNIVPPGHQRPPTADDGQDGPSTARGA